MSPALIVLLVGVLHAGQWEEMEVVATAYCPCTYCCGHRAVGITADGTRVSEVPYGVASDPRVLPYGTTIYIPTGHGYLDRSRTSEDARQFTVDDTGGILRQRTRATGITHIDLRFRTHWWAKQFGRKRITIYVWKE